MPRYFFHTHIDGDVLADAAGTELHDADAAWTVAHDSAEATLRANADPRLIGAVLVVTDADGEVVFEFPFAEAVTVEPGTDETVH